MLTVAFEYCSFASLSIEKFAPASYLPLRFCPRVADKGKWPKKPAPAECLQWFASEKWNRRMKASRPTILMPFPQRQAVQMQALSTLKVAHLLSQLARYSYSNHICVIPIPSQCKCPHLIGLGRLHNTIVIDIGSHSVLIACVNNHGIGVSFHLP